VGSCDSEEQLNANAASNSSSKTRESLSEDSMDLRQSFFAKQGRFAKDSLLDSNQLRKELLMATRNPDEIWEGKEDDPIYVDMTNLGPEGPLEATPGGGPGDQVSLKRYDGMTTSIFYPHRFEDIRNANSNLQNCENTFRLLSETEGQNLDGGKRGNFYITPDKRLIIKTIEKQEMLTFWKFAKSYFDYVEKRTEDLPSTLVGILGAFCIKGTRSKRFGFSSSYVVLMENLFPNRSKYRVFDLKGCNYGRAMSGDTGGERNLLDMLNGGALYLSADARQRLLDAINRDTEFLMEQGIIDYSLLLGVDEETKTVVCGIVDYCRDYGTMEKFEDSLKGGRTVAKPDVYRERFCSFMRRIFAVSPRLPNGDVHWIE